MTTSQFILASLDIINTHTSRVVTFSILYIALAITLALSSNPLMNWLMLTEIYLLSVAASAAQCSVMIRELNINCGVEKP